MKGVFGVIDSNGGVVNQAYTHRERAHIDSVKSLPCSVCDAPGPSQAHHIKQSLAYSCVALCQDCHQGYHNGIHGLRAIWRIMKMEELDALCVTIERLGLT